jgi:hypothetical protein
MKPKLKPPGTKRLKLQCDILLSTSAFKFNLRHYIEEPINEFYSTSSGVTPTIQVAYVGSGRFTTHWTTTLAGQYDIAVLVRPCNDQREFSSPTFDAICAAVPCVDTAKGKARGVIENKHSTDLDSPPPPYTILRFSV